MEARQIRQLARDHLSGNWAVSIGVAAVAALLGDAIMGSSFLPDIRVYENFLSREIFSTARWGGSFRIYFTGGFLGLASFLLSGVLGLGYAQFLLKQHDGQTPDFGDLFSQFDRFGTGFAQAFLRSLYTILWSLLFIIPGIVASLSYSLTPFILAEHPELTASQAIRRSKELMNGRKMDLFFLQLTFLGWSILAALTLNFGHLILNPYKNAAMAVFYREATRPGA